MRVTLRVLYPDDARPAQERTCDRDTFDTAADSAMRWLRYLRNTAPTGAPGPHRWEVDAHLSDGSRRTVLSGDATTVHIG